MQPSKSTSLTCLVEVSADIASMEHVRYEIH